jgi:Arm DNA-binding domain
MAGAAMGERRLSHMKVTHLSKPGLYPDGVNLWLQVTRGKSGICKSWVFRYSINCRARSMGLGRVDEVSIAKARAAADDARKLVRSGIDPGAIPGTASNGASSKPMLRLYGPHQSMKWTRRQSWLVCSPFGRQRPRPRPESVTE